MSVQSFKDLIVWQRSITLVSSIYELTEMLPAGEQFGLMSQMRRCAISIPSNIAEGKKRGSGKDFVHFLRIAAGSAAELETQLIITANIYPKLTTHKQIKELEEIQKMLAVLISKLVN